MKTLHLTKGYVTQVDNDTYKWAKQLKWCASDSNGVYAMHGGSPTILLHRLIMGAQPGQEVDHIDGDGLNNRKRNLRICTKAQNQRNQRPQKGGTSVYKGVYWHKDGKKWRGQIKLNGKTIYLGSFDNELDAAKVYDLAALKYHGEFANLNFKC
jgi:hypothetical protein